MFNIKLSSDNASLRIRLYKNVVENKKKLDLMNVTMNFLHEKFEHLAVDSKNKDGLINKILMRLDNYEKNDVHMPDSHPLEALSARLNIIENNIEESNIISNFPLSIGVQ